MTQKQKIFNALSTQGTQYPGITIRRLADRAGVPLDNVFKRVHDLRNEGWAIYTNSRKVNGRRVNYYRLAD